MARIAIPDAAQIAQLNASVARMVANKDGERLLERFKNQAPLFLFLSPENHKAFPLILLATGNRPMMPMPATFVQDFLALDPSQLVWFLKKEGYTKEEIGKLTNLRSKLVDSRDVVLPEDTTKSWQQRGASKDSLE